MDERTVAWLHLLPANSRFAVEQVPHELCDLLGSRVANDGNTYLGKQLTALQEPISSCAYDSFVLVNPPNADVLALRAAGFFVYRFGLLPSLTNPRWFIPLCSPHIAAKGLNLIEADDLLAKTVKSLIRHTTALGCLWHFTDTLVLARRCKSELETQLERLTDLPQIYLALNTSTPRDDRKTTLQIMAANSAIVGFAKLATSPLARERVLREADHLHALAECSELRGSIPEQIGIFDTGDATVSVQTSGPDQKGPGKFGEAHRSFLSKLAVATGGQMQFRHSLLWHSLQSKAEALASQLPLAWRERLSRAVSDLDATLGCTELRMVTAHRDFAPWNTRLHPDGRLFVFDWEAAQPEMTPLYDAFNFQFVSFETCSVGMPPQQVADRILRAVWHWEPTWDVTSVRALFLAYLVDRALSRLKRAVWSSDLQNDRVLRLTAGIIDVQLHKASSLAP